MNTDVGLDHVSDRSVQSFIARFKSGQPDAHYSSHLDED